HTEYRSIIHPGDLADFDNWWADLINSKKPGQTELRLRRIDGEYRWFHVTVKPVHDEQGTLVRWYGVHTDIDERKRAEQEVRQKEEDLRTIVDAIRQFIVVLAPDGSTLYANRVALENTGLTCEDLPMSAAAGRPAAVPGELAWNPVWRKAGHPDDVDRIEAERRDGLLRGAPFELEARCIYKTGQYR